MEQTAVRVFGSPNSQPVLGKHTLHAFGLTVDEAARTLVAAGLHLG